MSKRAIRIAGGMIQATAKLDPAQRAILSIAIDIPLLVGAYLLAGWAGVFIAMISPPYIHIREALTR